MDFNVITTIVFGALSAFYGYKTWILNRNSISEHQIEVMNPAPKALLLVLKMKNIPLYPFNLEYTWSSVNTFHNNMSSVEPRYSVYPDPELPKEERENIVQSVDIKFLLNIGSVSIDANNIKLTNKGKSMAIAIEKEKNIQIRMINEDLIDPFWYSQRKRFKKQ